MSARLRVMARADTGVGDGEGGHGRWRRQTRARGTHTQRREDVTAEGTGEGGHTCGRRRRWTGARARARQWQGYRSLQGFIGISTGIMDTDTHFGYPLEIPIPGGDICIPPRISLIPPIYHRFMHKCKDLPSLTPSLHS